MEQNGRSKLEHSVPWVHMYKTNMRSMQTTISGTWGPEICNLQTGVLLDVDVCRMIYINGHNTY